MHDQQKHAGNYGEQIIQKMRDWYNASPRAQQFSTFMPSHALDGMSTTFKFSHVSIIINNLKGTCKPLLLSGLSDLPGGNTDELLDLTHEIEKHFGVTGSEYLMGGKNTKYGKYDDYYINPNVIMNFIMEDSWPIRAVANAMEIRARRLGQIVRDDYKSTVVSALWQKTFKELKETSDAHKFLAMRTINPFLLGIIQAMERFDSNPLICYPTEDGALKP